MDSLFESYTEAPVWQRVLLVVMFLGLLLAGWFQFVFAPLQSKISLDENQRLQWIQKQRRQSVQLKDVVQTQNAIASLEQSLQSYRQLLPAQVDMPQLLSQIQALADRTGVEVSSFRELESGAQKPFPSEALEYTLRGGYHPLAQFADGVAQVTPMTIIRTMTMRHRKQDGQIEARLRLDVYSDPKFGTDSKQGQQR